MTTTYDINDLCHAIRYVRHEFKPDAIITIEMIAEGLAHRALSVQLDELEERIEPITAEEIRIATAFRDRMVDNEWETTCGRARWIEGDLGVYR